MVRGVTVVFRCAALLAAVLVAACAQHRDEVRVRTGVGLDHVKPARDFAALYLPYAKMASLAYTDPIFLSGSKCPDPRKLVHPGTQEQNERNKFNRVWLSDLNRQGWSCAFGVIDPADCPKDRPLCNPVAGLEMHAWTRGCAGVLAFRGTDADQPGDWLSNFRIVRRFVNAFDEYDQVGFLVDGWVRHIGATLHARGCRTTQIAAVGHSLGGGLAQNAAYADGKVRYVYVFNASPVTGLLDIFPDILVGHREGLGIDRVNEGGEILEGLRVAAGGFAQPARCNPRVRIVRFATRADLPSAVARHGIVAMAADLQTLAPGGRPARVAGEASARNCNFVDDDEARHSRP